MSPQSDRPDEPGARAPAARSTSIDAGPAPFRCDVSRDDHTASVRTVGELDLATVPVLSAQLARVRQAGCRHVVFDLSALSFMDSTGLCFFLQCYAAGRQDGFTMAMLPGPPAVQRVFELTDTAERLPFIAR